MNTISKSLSVMQFELRRSWTFGRMSAFWVLSLFPPAMVLLVSITAGNVPSFLPIIVFLTFIVCILSLLLWATPNVYAELENRNWIYLTSRPGGRISLLIGKWMSAVLAAFFVCAMATTLSWAIVMLRGNMFTPEGLTSIGRIWFRLLWIWFLACMNYAALFSLIGVLFQRRAMVIATIYTLVNEVTMVAVPALISKFSVRYHLVAVGYNLFDWFLPGREPEQQVLEMSILGLPLWANYLALTLAPVVLLVIAGFVIRTRQYITVDEA